jgi:flagellar biogenesis protein FliO
VQSIFGLQLAQPVVYIAALAIILILLAVFAWVLRKISGRTEYSERNPRGRQPRLGIVDTFSLDRQRQLVIIRRDSVEHLLLLGGTNDLVVESNIVRAASNPPSTRETPPPSRTSQPVLPRSPSPNVQAPAPELSFSQDPSPSPMTAAAQTAPVTPVTPVAPVVSPVISAAPPPLVQPVISARPGEFSLPASSFSTPPLAEIASRFESASALRAGETKPTPALSAMPPFLAATEVSTVEKPSAAVLEQSMILEPRIEEPKSMSGDGLSIEGPHRSIEAEPAAPLSATRDINSLNDTLRQLLGRTRDS